MEEKSKSRFSRLYSRIAFAFIFALLLAVLLVLLAGASSSEGLKITEIEAHVDYDKPYVYRMEHYRDESSYVNIPVINNSKINADIFPGSNVTFTIRAENTFHSEKKDMRNVFASIKIEEMDDGGDLSGESASFDLEPGDDERFDVKFNIPIDVKKSSYNVLVEVEGEGRNSTFSSEKIKLNLEVKKLSHDIRITKVSLIPSKISCDEKAKLTVRIANAGSSIEDGAALEFSSSELNLNSIDRGIYLTVSQDRGQDTEDGEAEYTKSLSIKNPPSLKNGDYLILMNLYWKDSILFDRKTAELTVRNCAGSGPANPNPEEEIVMQNETSSKTAGEKSTPADGYYKTKASPSLNLPAMISIFLGIFILGLIAALIILWSFVK